MTSGLQPYNDTPIFELFTALEQETLTCLNKIDSMQVEDLERFLEKRFELLDAIQKIDFGSGGRAGSFPETHDSFQKKNGMQLVPILKRVIEANGLLIALAEERKCSLKAQLSKISRGRSALAGYCNDGGNGLQSPIR